MRENALLVRKEHAAPRSAFLRAIRSETPEALTALRQQVLPAYTALPDKLKTETSRGFKLTRIGNNVEFLFLGADPELQEMPLPDIMVYSSLSLHEKSYPAVTGLENTLGEWARKFNLKDPWLLDLALQTLYRWAQNKRALDDLEWGGPSYSTPPTIVTTEESRFEFSDPGWLPGYETWQDFEKGIKADFTDYFEKYKSRIVGLAESRGFQQPPETRNAQHYKWLAYYQVRGASPAEIAEEFTRRDASGSKALDETTIFKAVEKTAGLIGLSLRPSKKGRRKKT